MTPERLAEIQKIATGLGSHGLLVGIIHELIAEVERLTAELQGLQAELAERERQIEALGRARWSGLGE